MNFLIKISIVSLQKKKYTDEKTCIPYYNNWSL